MIQSCSEYGLWLLDNGKLAERQGRKATGSNVRKNDDSLAADMSRMLDILGISGSSLAGAAFFFARMIFFYEAERW